MYCLSRYVSEIEGDPVGSYRKCRLALAELGLEDVTDEDCSAIRWGFRQSDWLLEELYLDQSDGSNVLVRYICELVSRRAGFLSAAGVTALLKKMDYRDVVVAVDGSLFRHHPHFNNIMRWCGD